REVTLKEDRVVIQEARGAFDSDRKEFEERSAQSDEESRRRGDDLDGQAKTLGESQLHLAQEKETFEAERTEKSQAILSREIELEACEQSLREKEDAVRYQAGENARRFAQEAASARASWADRMMRIEAREVDLEEKEEKVRTDVDWVARSDEDLKRREKAVEEAGRTAAQVQANAERVAKEAEQRFLEIESRERALREEAAHEAIELTKHTEAV